MDKTWEQIRQQFECELQCLQNKMQKPFRDGTLTVKLYGNKFIASVEDDDFKQHKLVTVEAYNDNTYNKHYASAQYNTQNLVDQVVLDVFGEQGE